MTEITSNIYYVGVNDRNKNLFEGLWPLPKGVSYNSYLIVDEKVCLVDTVEVDFFTQFIENIREVIGDRPIDYIVVNHMEPDHSGSLALMRKYYPNVTVIGNKKTFGMMAGFYGIEGGCEHEVKNGDTLVPHRTVGRADVVDLNASKLLQRVLHRYAILAHDVAVIAYHLHPERVAVDVAVNNAAVEGAEASESIA